MEETVKTVLQTMIQEDMNVGFVTENMAAFRLTKMCGIGNDEALTALRNHYLAAGFRQTTRNNGAIIVYEKAPQQKEPEESVAVRIAKRLGKRNIGEKQREDILKYYIR